MDSCIYQREVIMKIGIMGAMTEEVALIQKDMQADATKSIGGRDYYTGELFGIDTTVVFSRWGKVASSSTASTLINTFGADYIIFTGVAGATAQHLNIGDVVIANKLYQHDMDATPFFDKYSVPLLSRTYFYTDKNLFEKSHTAAQNFVDNDMESCIEAEILSEFSISQPKVYSGTIASGDQFVTDPVKIANLLKEQPETVAVEMEGAAVAQVCCEHETPFIVIRTISDKADHSAPVDFANFISKISNHYSHGIIKNLYGLILKG